MLNSCRSQQDASSSECWGTDSSFPQCWGHDLHLGGHEDIHLLGNPILGSFLHLVSCKSIRPSKCKLWCNSFTSHYKHAQTEQYKTRLRKHISRTWGTHLGIILSPKKIVFKYLHNFFGSPFIFTSPTPDQSGVYKSSSSHQTGLVLSNQTPSDHMTYRGPFWINPYHVSP